MATQLHVNKSTKTKGSLVPATTMPHLLLGHLHQQGKGKSEPLNYQEALKYFVRITTQAPQAPQALPSSSTAEDTASDPFLSIQPFDVVLGRGKGTANHSGNRLYRLLLKANGFAYSKAKDKSAFTKRLVQEVQTFGRFVKNFGDSSYAEITDQSARIIVAQVRFFLNGNCVLTEKGTCSLLFVSNVVLQFERVSATNTRKRRSGKQRNNKLKKTVKGWKRKSPPRHGKGPRTTKPSSQLKAKWMHGNRGKSLARHKITRNPQTSTLFSRHFGAPMPGNVPPTTRTTTLLVKEVLLPGHQAPRFPS